MSYEFTSDDFQTNVMSKPSKAEMSNAFIFSVSLI